MLTFETPEKRIAQVAWRWNRQYNYNHEYRARGFSEEEISIGTALGLALENEYGLNRRVYGDPAYGRWPDEAQQPLKKMVLGMQHGETEVFREWLKNKAEAVMK